MISAELMEKLKAKGMTTKGVEVTMIAAAMIAAGAETQMRLRHDEVHQLAEAVWQMQHPGSADD